MDPTTLVVLNDGEPLPPVRISCAVIVPGYFGEKTVKWITRIEVADANAQVFTRRKGWAGLHRPTRSRFDQRIMNRHLTSPW